MIVVLLLTAIAFVLGLVISLEKTAAPYLGGVVYMSPVSVSIFSVAIKVIIGGVLVYLLGFYSLPKGEYLQYIVTHKYLKETLEVWLIWACGLALVRVFSAALTRKSMHLSRTRCLWVKKESVGFPGSVLSVIQDLLSGIKIKNVKQVLSIILALGTLAMSFYLVGTITGSIDRGAESYAFWATQKWKPTDLFVSVSRTKVIYFFLGGLTVNQARGFWKLSLFSVMAVVTILSLMSGGRGEFFFSVLAFAVGFFVVSGNWKRYKIIGIGVLLGIIVYIPVMGAVREMDQFKMSSIKSPAERTAAIVTSLRGIQGLDYRISSLGREVYACSDGFLFTPANRNVERHGFDDLSMQRIMRIVVPSFIHGQSVEKLDGSRIAQRLMGIKFQETWFPCMSLPGDLFRRGSYLSVFTGGLSSGLILTVAQMLWKRILASRFTIGKLLIVLLPITFIQSLPFGTVQETIWFWLWDLPKYVILFIGVDLCLRVPKSLRRS